MTKFEIFVPHQTTTQLFILRRSCLKHQNNILSSKNHIKQEIIQYHKNLSCVVMPCVVLFCIVLFCPVLTVLQTKRTLKAQVNMTYIIIHF